MFVALGPGTVAAAIGVEKPVTSASRTDLLRTSPKASVGACRTSSPQVGAWDGEVEGDDADTHILVPKKRRSRGHVAATPGTYFRHTTSGVTVQGR